MDSQTPQTPQTPQTLQTLQTLQTPQTPLFKMNEVSFNTYTNKKGEIKYTIILNKDSIIKLINGNQELLCFLKEGLNL